MLRGSLLQNGILLGLLVGTAQWGVLRIRNRVAAHWILTTIAGYAIGSTLGYILPLGLALGTTRLLKMALIGEGGSASLIFPLLPTMFLSGAVVALLQWVSARTALQNDRARAITLWVLGSAVAWAIAFASATYTWAAGASSAVQSAVAGAAIGTGTGFLLMTSSVLSTRTTMEPIN